MFVKICGITRPVDAVAAVEAGADAIGLNFVPMSPRCVDHGTAREIQSVTPEHVMSVGIFLGHSARHICEISGALDLDAVQLHGEATEEAAAVGAAVPTVIQVVTVTPGQIPPVDDAADIVMLDGPTPGGGVPFDWSRVGDLVSARRILLAGGLHPGNVTAAIQQVQPWGVDVASGVESKPGSKDPDAIARFVALARAAARLVC